MPARTRKLDLGRVDLSSTRDRALVIATGMIQTYGYEGFSFQHVADRLGIRKASLYAHFTSKEQLVREVLRRNLTEFGVWRESVAARSAPGQIGALFDMMYGFAARDGQYCPLSAMVASVHALPPVVRPAVAALYRCERDWLKAVIESGRRRGQLAAGPSSPRALAEWVLACALGAQVGARAGRDPALLRRLRRVTLRHLGA